MTGRDEPRKEGQDGTGPDRTMVSSPPPSPSSAEEGAAPDRTRLSVPPDAPGDAGDERTAFMAPGGGEDATRISVSSAPSGPDASPAAEEVRVPILSAGTVINNNYRIAGVLSSGGMGAVYHGVEIGTGDPVAIKAILPDLAADPRAGALFRSEARMLRQLADDAIVRYYNYVHDHALERYFLVMEFIEGITLSDHMARSGPLPPAAAEALIRRLARALSRAHALGVIHRDLSPDNVMLPGGAVAEARLIDFGIARSARLSEEEAPGTFAGKLKYVAPEQLGHFGGHVGPETDIYGLALLVGAALSGRALPMGNSIEEAAERRRRVPDLSGVSSGLRPLLTHMLEPDPAARPASMEEVLRLIEHPHLLPPRYGGPSAAVPGGLTLPPGLGRPGAARAAGA
ncbi:serine/threonine protein kinase, partial [Rhodovulum sulfidophilum]|uniref:serine/threonine-protein kinase n=2 Tax=Rhodovulum sulfidophilum TaxID=35806 RepID=UPI001F1707BC